MAWCRDSPLLAGFRRRQDNRRPAKAVP